jgi:hypothetical protein
MKFGWINGINTAAVISLILINMIAVRKEKCSNLRSKHWMVNLFEQIGRYGCMLFMIFPFFTRNWKFGFGSVGEMLLWLGLTVLLLMIYVIFWMRKRDGRIGMMYGLAAVPVILFLMNGILLRHPALIAVSLIFGVCHLTIVRENS